MLDHYTAPQMQRVESEMTERDAIRAAEAWLADQDARLSMMRPRHREWDWPLVLEEARNFLLAVTVLGLALYGLLSIGGL